MDRTVAGRVPENVCCCCSTIGWTAVGQSFCIPFFPVNLGITTDMEAGRLQVKIEENRVFQNLVAASAALGPMDLDTDSEASPLKRSREVAPAELDSVAESSSHCDGQRSGFFWEEHNPCGIPSLWDSEYAVVAEEEEEEDKEEDKEEDNEEENEASGDDVSMGVIQEVQETRLDTSDDEVPARQPHHTQDGHQCEADVAAGVSSTQRLDEQSTSPGKGPRSTVASFEEAKVGFGTSVRKLSSSTADPKQIEETFTSMVEEFLDEPAVQDFAKLRDTSTATSEGIESAASKVDKLEANMWEKLKTATSSLAGPIRGTRWEAGGRGQSKSVRS